MSEKKLWKKFAIFFCENTRIMGCPIFANILTYPPCPILLDSPNTPKNRTSLIDVPVREKKTKLSYKTILSILSSECNCYFKMCHFFFPFFPFVAKFVRHWKIGLSESKCLKYLLLVLLRTFFVLFFYSRSDVCRLPTKVTQT